MKSRAHIAILLLALSGASQTQILIRGGRVVDGTGEKERLADVRIVGRTIAAIGKLRPKKGELVISARNLVVAPGFIDAHSHADGALDKLESQVRQGITTAVVGQDGSNRVPLSEFFAELDQGGAELNFAAFCGHGTLRSLVMKDDYKRTATPAEVEKMRILLTSAMKSGALGLSSGLEYDPGHYSSFEELLSLAKVAGQSGGMYISHMRDEGNGFFSSLDELMRIAKEGSLPAQVSHIKVAARGVWGTSKQALQRLQFGRQKGLKVTADVYPYTFWQSTITAMTTSRDWENSEMWARALEENGGADRVTLTRYSPNPSWESKTLAALATETGRTPAELVVEIVRNTRDGKGQESILCESMTQQDLETFLKWPNTMVCSDGAGGGSHPRGAGAFPRVLALYVREKKLLGLTEAVRKMTRLPAQTFKLAKRGQIKQGYFADIVVFDPAKIQDRANAKDPRAMATGVSTVIVNGEPVLLSGKMTGKKPGRAVRRSSTR